MPRLELSRDARQDLLEIAAYIARESGQWPDRTGYACTLSQADHFQGCGDAS